MIKYNPTEKENFRSRIVDDVIDDQNTHYKNARSILVDMQDKISVLDEAVVSASNRFSLYDILPSEKKHLDIGLSSNPIFKKEYYLSSPFTPKDLLISGAYYPPLGGIIGSDYRVNIIDTPVTVSSHTGFYDGQAYFGIPCREGDLTVSYHVGTGNMVFFVFDSNASTIMAGVRSPKSSQSGKFRQCIRHGLNVALLDPGDAIIDLIVHSQDGTESFLKMVEIYKGNLASQPVAIQFTPTTTGYYKIVADVEPAGDFFIRKSSKLNTVESTSRGGVIDAFLSKDTPYTLFTSGTTVVRYIAYSLYEGI